MDQHPSYPCWPIARSPSSNLSLPSKPSLRDLQTITHSSRVPTHGRYSTTTIDPIARWLQTFPGYDNPRDQPPYQQTTLKQPQSGMITHPQNTIVATDQAIIEENLVFDTVPALKTDLIGPVLHKHSVCLHPHVQPN